MGDSLGNLLTLGVWPSCNDEFLQDPTRTDETL